MFDNHCITYIISNNGIVVLLHCINIGNKSLHGKENYSLITKATIHITGIVQGVGFRPFIYREAILLKLTGYVLNLGDAGVRIVVEGEKSRINKLIEIIKAKPPSISRIDSVSISWDESEGKFDTFLISKSSPIRENGAVTEIPPDIAICDDCVEDLFSPKSRWYLYPFTSCAACGPRFSTITDLPYDRPNTTMTDFPLCNICNTGYTNPFDRRYHAQTTACFTCGPEYKLMNNDGEIIETEDVVLTSTKLLKERSIIAVQGIAGTHLVTITSQPDPILELRRRKRRDKRPFAVMVKDLLATYQISKPTDFETQLITSWRRPIVLIRKKYNSNANFEHELISPGLDTIGVMLPYAPIHHLFFNHLDEIALLMTSANPTGLPMFIEPKTIISKLQSVADYFLIHNRRIHQRADDSVLKIVHEDNPVFLRRARGYVPDPLKVKSPNDKITILGLGPEEKVTGAILKSDYIYQTQHIGDADCLETAEFLLDASIHLMDLVGVSNLDAIACDLHPEFITTKLGRKIADDRDIPLIRVQHHHAHLASLMGEHRIDNNTSITCITVDGFGYGDDGTAWGGEILTGNLSEYTKKGGIKPVILPGGDMTARYASRSLFGLLRSGMTTSDIHKILKGHNVALRQPASIENLLFLEESIKKGINTMTSSSAGRFLDAVSLALGVCSENSYDGECPMKLESIAKESDSNVKIEYSIERNLSFIDTSKFLRELLELKNNGMPKKYIAYIAQWELGSALAEIACDVSISEGIEYVGISGGVALNRIITSAVIKKVLAYNLTPLIHRNIPPGDGGISSGQVLVASAKLLE